MPILRRISPPWVIGLVFALLSVRLFSYVAEHSVNLLFWDHWDFYEAYFNNTGLVDLFRWQHGPHRQGLGGLVMKAIDSLSGWDTRVESFACTGFFVFSAGLALWLKRRLSGRWHYTDALIALIFLRISIWEALFGTVNLAHGAIPLMLVLIFALALSYPASVGRQMVLVVVDGLATFTGFGICLGLIGPVIFSAQFWYARKDPRSGWLLAGSVVASLLFLGLFFTNYRSIPSAECFVFPDPKPWRYVLFLGGQMASAIGVYNHRAIPIVIGLIVASFLVRLFTRTIQNKAFVLTFLLAYAAAFSVNLAIGRACIGVGAALTSRYIPFLMPAILALYCYGVMHAEGHLKTRLLWGLLVMLVVNDFVTTPIFFRRVPGMMAKRAEWAECYRQKENIDACSKETGVDVYPAPPVTHLNEKLQFLKEHRLNLFHSKS
ncbi:MAG: hypothetical protein HYR96_11845 [Deltaproteobacteria bacterium]|nr:hypothetical protein [Deltaproteobacteria bacterium]MBI3294533.1 hypothetical protein [Deltaproteobacteria bacterium]